MLRGVACLLAVLATASGTHTQSVAIESIEVTQGVGVQLGGARKFVAGKDTVVRALLASPITVDPATTSVAITRDGSPVVTLTPNNYDTPVSAVDFQCPSLLACGGWAAGSYVFAVTVNGSSRSTSGTTYAFVERAPLRILAVPVKARYNGTVKQVPDEKWKTMGSFTRATYPVGREQFKWITQAEVDASDAKFDLETDAGRLELWQALTNLMPAHCANSPRADGCFDKIIGFISDRPMGYPAGRLQGYTYGHPSNIVVATDEDAAATVAHEVAHNYAAGDTYNGGTLRCSANPAPDEFSGRDWDDSTKTVKCSAGRVALPGTSATLVPGSAHPYEIGGRGLLGDMACYMGSGGQQPQFWTSQEVFDLIFERSAPVAPASNAAAIPVQRFIEFFGMIRRDPRSAADIELEPWESYDEAFDEPDTTGPLMIAAVDAAGHRLATSALDADFDIPGARGSEPQFLAAAPFLGAMRFPRGTVRFQFISHGQVIHEVDVSPHEPVVSAVTPLAPQVINGPYVVRWQASDADGDDLTYSVEYNADVTRAGSEWVTLVEDLEDAFWQEDFSELGGGNHARIRVKANDGFNTGSSVSAEFTVPGKAPEVYIDPPKATTIVEGQELAFSCESYDLQDDELDEANVKWSSSIAGPIGTGSLIVAKGLKVGIHTISVAGTNSLGLSSTQRVTVTVVPGRRRIPR
jgi:hypothetical protein